MHSAEIHKPRKDETVLNWWSKFLEYVSGERLLQKWPNGGDIILLRSLRVTLFIAIPVIFLRHIVEPDRMFWTFNVDELRSELSKSIPVIGAIFAGVYAALYARFASQWGYLAGVYNQIKAAEARLELSKPEPQALASWKAGFIEDAEHLHLATKPSVAPIILAWAKLRGVRAAFVKATPGGARRLEELLNKVRRADARERLKYRSSAHEETAQISLFPTEVTVVQGLAKRRSRV